MKMKRAGLLAGSALLALTPVGMPVAAWTLGAVAVAGATSVIGMPAFAAGGNGGGGATGGQAPGDAGADASTPAGGGGGGAAGGGIGGTGSDIFGFRAPLVARLPAKTVPMANPPAVLAVPAARMATMIRCPEGYLPSTTA